ncbi:MAG: hypothetical protein ABSF28_26240 [Terracidiphilus sp.]|jgi:hypothetical protein
MNSTLPKPFPARTLACAVILCSLFACTCIGQQTGLLAHDLSGFTLDMTVDQVTAVAAKPLTQIAAGHYQVTVLGTDYDFGFTPLGHLYRIDSRQQLGLFTPDPAFAPTLSERLIKKFGQPLSNQLITGPAMWMFEEPYAGPKGEKLTRETESLTVLVTGGKDEPVTVEMQLVAPRILRRDGEKK